MVLNVSYAEAVKRGGALPNKNMVKHDKHLLAGEHDMSKACAPNHAINTDIRGKVNMYDSSKHVPRVSTRVSHLKNTSEVVKKRDTIVNNYHCWLYEMYGVI